MSFTPLDLFLFDWMKCTIIPATGIFGGHFRFHVSQKHGQLLALRMPEKICELCGLTSSCPMLVMQVAPKMQHLQISGCDCQTRYTLSS